MNTALSYPHIELKDVEDDPANIVTKALDDLRGTVEQRFTVLETKAGDVAKIVGRLDKIEARLNRPGAQNDNTTKDDGIERKAFTAFIRSGREALSADEVKSLRVGDDPSGGYLAPPEVSTEMIRLLTLFSPVRKAASVRQTGSASVILPKRTAITNAQWEGEIEEATESEPVFGQVEITVNGMRTYTDISQNLLEDSFQNLELELAEALAEDFGRKEGIAFINGSGVKQPRGLMVHPEVQFVPVSGGAITPASLVNLTYSLPEYYRNTSVWMMNAATLGLVRILQNSIGQFIWQPSLQAGQPSTLLGFPLIEAPDMPNVGVGSFPILFGDIGQAYRIYDRIALSVLRDPYTMATSGLVRFHARRRVGGDVMKAEAIRKLKIT